MFFSTWLLYILNILQPRRFPTERLRRKRSEARLRTAGKGQETQDFRYLSITLSPLVTSASAEGSVPLGMGTHGSDCRRRKKRTFFHGILAALTTGSKTEHMRRGDPLAHNEFNQLWNTYTLHQGDMSHVLLWSSEGWHLFVSISKLLSYFRKIFCHKPACIQKKKKKKKIL